MCGRYTLSYVDLARVASAVGCLVDPDVAASYRPRYNIAPSSTAIIARPQDATSPVLVQAHWGLEMYARLVFNVRAETAGRRFGPALTHRRCIVPADGFYEWAGERTDRRPIWFHHPDGEVLLMAGIFDMGAETRPRFAILTVDATPPVSEIHSRMPLLFSPQSARRWLDRLPDGQPASDEVPLVGVGVSRRVNAVANDDATCLEPEAATATAPPAERGQMRLF
jgi:putative SOS response-associated peptidase YedK